MALKVRRFLVVDPPPSPQQQEEEKPQQEVSQEEEEDDDEKSQQREDDDESEEEKHDDESKQEKHEESVQPKPHKIPDKNMKKKNPPPQPEYPESTKASDFTIKPSAKPTKRKPQTNAHNAKPSKLNKLKHNDKSRVSVKKRVISRLWSEQDEIAILKGLIEFQSKTGKDPSTSANQLEFYDFLNKSLQVDVSRHQLMDKVKRLKAKFNNSLSNQSVNAGEDPLLSNPHQYNSFHLSMHIWGNNHANNATNYETKSSLSTAKKKSRGDDKLVPHVVLALDATKDQIKVKGDKDVKLVNLDITKDVIKVKDDKTKVQEKEEGFAKLYPFLMNGITSSGYMSDTSALSEFVLNKVNKNLNLVCGTELKELDGEWKELKLMETQLFLRKLHLIQKQTNMLLDAIKSFS